MTLEERLDTAEAMMRKPSFRQNKGLGNEVGYYIFDYPPEQELLVRERIEYIKKKNEQASLSDGSPVSVFLLPFLLNITNLITSLDFVQSEAVSDVVKETTYRICFVDDRREKISNEHLYKADKKDSDSVKRMFRLRFSFKNIKYDKYRKYYLVAFDDKTGLETLHHEVVMDIAFANDF